MTAALHADALAWAGAEVDYATGGWWITQPNGLRFGPFPTEHRALSELEARRAQANARLQGGSADPLANAATRDAAAAAVSLVPVHALFDRMFGVSA